MAFLTYQGATAPAPPAAGAALQKEVAALPPELAKGRAVYALPSRPARSPSQGLTPRRS